MTIKLTTELLNRINLFELSTGVTVRDCIETEDKLIFVIEKGQLRKALGKNCSNLYQLKKLTQKNIQVIEYSEIPEIFIRNVFRDYDVKKVEITQRGNIKHATVTVNPAFKAKSIGKNGKNLKVARDTISRSHDIQSVSVM